ncbi:MAG: hypothetical protein H8D56_15240 [Planctomycetes bacterium]|nr:hypothetical protein [Planctomycetota bacterium]MBL7144609.1 hypothetical protein [Phycisphaerae bacterium]
MERKAIVKVVLVCLLIVSFILPVQVSAQSRSRRGGLYGDWQIKMKFGEREFESILAFSRNQEGEYTGYWISFWGMNELKDVKFEENKLSFTQVTNYGGEERASKFTGTIEEGELSGLLMSDRGETEINGKRAPRAPRGVGSWEMKIKAGEREYTGTLMITADKEGNLSGTWKSSRGGSEVSDLKYENRTLTFKRIIQRDSDKMEMAFEGTVSNTSLEGVFKSERGEAAATGTLAGASVIGTWNLDIESERGSRKQRLRVNSDMSALYGSTLIKKINLEGDKVSFKYVLQFNDQDYETSFEGKIAESKLTGELTTSRGTSKVTGTRRTFRRPGSSQR